MGSVFGWNKEENILVTDMNITNINGLLNDLWDNGYQSLEGIKQLNANIDNTSIAEYVASYVKLKYNLELSNLKRKYKNDNSNSNFCVDLINDIRPWNINN